MEKPHLESRVQQIVESRLIQIQKALQGGRNAFWVYTHIFHAEKAAGTVTYRQIQDIYLCLTNQPMEARNQTTRSQKNRKTSESAASALYAESRRYVHGVDLAQYKGAKYIPGSIIEMVLDHLTRTE